ncbi:MAG: hypothetical protein A2231_11095 [Candidatus Firestonebacteria bacterium RIFOXYA2_FULL_40_8]|nr:MAG: hypothetical protein A2231_11095 [Candidatus Firestonebacteria bacterium RIFOXYA2_FULL_40_8]
MQQKENFEDIAGLLIESPYPIFRVSPEGKLLYANEAGKCLLAKWDCVVGQKVNTDFAVQVAEAYRENLIKNNVDVQCMERIFSFTFVPSCKGKYVNIYGVDNTERRKAEKELEKIHKQVIYQERLKAIGQMSSGIIHDLNNALFPALGFSETLIKNPSYLENKDKTLDYLKKIHGSAKHAAGIISRLKDFYRSSPANTILLPVDFNKLIKDVVGLTRPRWKDEMESRGVAINVETDLKGVLPVAAEESELRELIVNLIFNAVDAMPAGGKIVMSTRSEEEKVIFEIKDTGSGMPEQVKLHCFDPFFSTKGAKGTGLGLAMVYGTVKRYNGTIKLESEEDKGTRFMITLPVWHKGMSVAVADKESAPEKPVHILVVDDNPIIREVIKEYLLCDKHIIETAESGAEALNKFSKSAFDVVITDMAMPNMSGAELAALIKKKRKDIFVILLTGFGEIMTENNEKPEGVDFILDKPAGIEKLRAMVNELIKRGKDGK